MKDKNQNIVFGVLANGEIFVEVGGEQFTPDESFYKLATIESAKHAHLARDLQAVIDEIKTADYSELVKLRKGFPSPTWVFVVGAAGQVTLNKANVDFIERNPF